VRSPYGHGGYPWSTPDYTNNLLTGSLRIQAENFDAGGEGVAYHELTTTNLGGQYRTNEAVDIETTSDTGGGYDVTGTAAGEWLEYTIYVSEPGLYNLALRVAGTTAGSVQLLAGGINGTNLTGVWTVPTAGPLELHGGMLARDPGTGWGFTLPALLPPLLPRRCSRFRVSDSTTYCTAGRRAISTCASATI